MLDKKKIDPSWLKAKEYLYQFWHSKKKITKEIFESFLSKISWQQIKNKLPLSLSDMWSVDIIHDLIKWKEIEITRLFFGWSTEYFAEWLSSYIVNDQGIDKINQIISNVIKWLDLINQQDILKLFGEIGVDVNRPISNMIWYRWFVDTLINVSICNPTYRTSISVFLLRYISYILMSNYPIFQQKDDLLLQTKNTIATNIFGKEITYENNNLSDLISHGWSGSCYVSIADVMYHLQSNGYNLPISSFDSTFITFDANTKWINSAVDKMIAQKQYDVPMLMKDILRSTTVLKSSKDVIMMMYIILSNQDRINQSSDDVEIQYVDIEDKRMLFESFNTSDIGKIKKQIFKLIPDDVYWNKIFDAIINSKRSKTSSINGYRDAKFRISYNIKWTDIVFGSEMIFFDIPSRKIRENESAHRKKDIVKMFDTSARMEKLMPKWSIASLVDAHSDLIKQNIIKQWKLYDQDDLDQVIYNTQEEIKEDIRSKYIKIIYKQSDNDLEEKFYIHPQVLYDDIVSWYFPGLMGPFYIADNARDVISEREKLNRHLRMVYPKISTKMFIPKALDQANRLK